MKSKIDIIGQCISIENVRILEMLPSNIRDIGSELDLSKMPTNRRVNQLESAGLLIRERKSAKVNKSKITDNFLKFIYIFTNHDKGEKPKREKTTSRRIMR